MPMTTFGGDGQASALPIAVSEKPKMTEYNQSKTVEQSEITEGNSDKVAEGPIEEFEGWLDDQISDLEDEVEDLDELPTPSEAGMGELCRIPRRGQFQFEELVDDNSGDLIAVLEEEGR